MSVLENVSEMVIFHPGASDAKFDRCRTSITKAAREVSAQIFMGALLCYMLNMAEPGVILDWCIWYRVGREHLCLIRVEFESVSLKNISQSFHHKEHLIL